jgi:hypothetical protein
MWGDPLPVALPDRSAPALHSLRQYRLSNFRASIQKSCISSGSLFSLPIILTNSSQSWPVIGRGCRRFRSLGIPAAALAARSSGVPFFEARSFLEWTRRETL